MVFWVLLACACCKGLSGHCYAVAMRLPCSCQGIMIVLGLVGLLQCGCWHMIGCQGVAMQLLRCSDYLEFC